MDTNPYTPPNAVPNELRHAPKRHMPFGSKIFLVLGSLFVALGLFWACFMFQQNLSSARERLVLLTGPLLIIFFGAILTHHGVVRQRLPRRPRFW